MNKAEVAVIQDLEGINHVIRQLWAEPQSPFIPPYEFEASDIQSERSIIFVVRENARIVGYLSLHSRISFQRDTYAEFEIAVLEAFRGRGYGSALLEKAIQYIEGNTNLTQLKALVKHINIPVKRLCDKFGLECSSSDSQGEVRFLNIRR